MHSSNMVGNSVIFPGMFNNSKKQPSMKKFGKSTNQTPTDTKKSVRFGFEKVITRKLKAKRSAEKEVEEFLQPRKDPYTGQVKSQSPPRSPP
jgi:hypothetical protein